MCKQQSYIACLLLCIFWGIQLEKIIPHTHYTNQRHQLHVVFNTSLQPSPKQSTISFDSESLINEEEAHGFHYTLHNNIFLPVPFSHHIIFELTPINTVHFLAIQIDAYNLLAKIRALSDGHFYRYSNNSPPIV